MLKEFKEFALKGNVADMAVGIIIGGAFGKIVSSLVNDVVMPPIGMLLGKVDFSSLVVTLQATDEASGGKAIELRYGLFLNNVVDFLIVAFAVFLLVRQMNRVLRKPLAPNTKNCPHCLSVIPARATKCGHCTSAL